MPSPDKRWVIERYPVYTKHGEGPIEFSYACPDLMLHGYGSIGSLLKAIYWELQEKESEDMYIPREYIDSDH